MYKIVLCLVLVLQGNVRQKLIWSLWSICVILASVNRILLCRKKGFYREKVFLKQKGSGYWSFTSQYILIVFKKSVFQQLHKLLQRTTHSVHECTMLKIKNVYIWMTRSKTKEIFNNVILDKMLIVVAKLRNKTPSL